MITPRDAGHVVLIVEDDVETAAKLAAIVRSDGGRPIVTHNVKDALAVLEREDPCLILADHELPIDDGSPPLVGSGEYLITWARAHDTRLAPGTLFYVLQIIVVTAVSVDPDFVSLIHHLGATNFQAKPLSQEGVRSLVRKIGDSLEWAKRRRHEDCAQYARARAPGASLDAAGEVCSAGAVPEVGGPRLAIDGTSERSRMIVRIDGHRRDMSESPFVSLLLAVGVHARSPGAWSSRSVLRIPSSNSAVNRIRAPFDGLVSPGFHALEADRSGNCRLSPAIVVESVAWAVLLEHSNIHVRKVAKEMLDRGKPGGVAK